VLQIEH